MNSLNISMRGKRIYKKLFLWFLALGLVGGLGECLFPRSNYLITSSFAGEGGNGSLSGKALFLNFKGPIGPAQVGYLEAGLKRAKEQNAEVLVIILDTPGGQLQATREIIQKIEEASTPIAIYISPAGASATSAGALLSMSAAVIAMAPGTNLGSAHPVGGQGEEIKGVMGEKVTNDTSALARSLAEKHGRSVEIAEKIVSKSLNLSAREAVEKKFVDFLAEDTVQFLRHLNGREMKHGNAVKKIALVSDEIFVHQMSWAQKFLHFLANPNIATLLLSIGVFLIYAEFGAPGISFAGITGILLLLLGFSAFQLLPVRTTGLALLLVGIISLLTEFFISTHGILLVGGLVALVLGFLYVLDPSGGNFQISLSLIIPVVLSLGAFAGIVVSSAIRTKKLQKKVREEMKGGGESGLEGYRGQVITAHNASEPERGSTGTMNIRGEIWKFSSPDQICQGDHVEVKEVAGLIAKVGRIT